MGDRIYLSKEEQIYLMEMFEVKSIEEAVEKFAELMVLEKADPSQFEKYLRKIMKKALK